MYTKEQIETAYPMALIRYPYCVFKPHTCGIIISPPYIRSKIFHLFPFFLWIFTDCIFREVYLKSCFRRTGVNVRHNYSKENDEIFQDDVL